MGSERYRELYQRELKEHIEYLERSLRNLPGVEQGFLIRDEHGNVVGRVGRISYNPRWYQEFYKLYNRPPRKSELEGLAREHLDKGFYDSYGYIPPFADRVKDY